MQKILSTLTTYIRNNKPNIFIPLTIATLIVIAFSLQMIFWVNGLIFITAMTIWYFFTLDSMKAKIILFILCELAFIFLIRADSIQEILFAPIIIFAILFSGLLILFLFVIFPVIVSAFLLINIFRIESKLIKFILIVPPILYLYLFSYNHDDSAHHGYSYRNGSNIISATQTNDNKLCFYIEDTALLLDTFNSAKNFTVSEIKLSPSNERNVLWNKSYHENPKLLSSFSEVNNCLKCDANFSIDTNKSASPLYLFEIDLTQHSNIMRRGKFTYRFYFWTMKDKQTGELKFVKLPISETSRKEYEKCLGL
jgi:hypothetical protein